MAKWVNFCQGVIAGKSLDLYEAAIVDLSSLDWGEHEYAPHSGVAG